MGKILRMSPHLANMIAAGEVVERPSSVVKELVENAIDANATEIKVYLVDGGLSEIKIVDNGDGMDSDDVTMAFLPHATSKIKTEYDLFRILSLGFRGEAIASIASVSHMQIISSQDGINGYEVTYKAGIKQSSGITHHNKGTSVIVKNLFFNTPARLKYLKPAKSELASISYFMDRISLAHPDIRFSLINDGKNYLNTSGSDKTKNLIGEIYGLEAAKNIIEKFYVCDGYQAKLVLIKPSVYRSNKLEMTLIVNGRFVKNYDINNAIIEGYSTFLPIGKYPISVIYLDVDPLLVDVNVHPSKTEVKISNIEAICEKLKLEIRSMLENSMLIPTREVTTKVINETYQKESIFELPEMIFKDVSTNYQKEEPIILPKLEKTDECVDIPIPKSQEQKNGVSENLVKPKKEENRLPYFEYVGQIFGTYLIFQNEEGLYLVDQHAAAERINYEKYYEILGNENQPTTDTLVPIMLSFTKSEALYIDNNIESFNKIGFNLEAMSDTDYVIRSIPLWVKFDNIEVIIHDILALMIENRKVDVIHFRDSIAKQIACKSSIKANKSLSKIEIDSLMNGLKKCKNPFTCPHGRPTLIKFSISEIEKMFERIQK